MNIGIIGGTFNPIHHAHLRIAEEVRDQFRLDTVVFIPAAEPPHKPLAGDLPFAERFEMVRLAIEGNPHFSISDLEQQRGGKSYSIDTLRILRERYPEDVLHFIIGSDSFRDMGTWREYEAIFCCCNIIVVERPGAVIPVPEMALPPAIAGEFRSCDGGKQLIHRSGYSVYYKEGVPLDISSSTIRELAGSGRSIRYLVPEAVRQYITEKRLYQHG